MLTWLLLFLSSAGWVFIQAFQSRNINTGQYGLAAATSFGLGFLQVRVLSTVVSPEATFFDILTYCSGGAVGVVAAMWVHRAFIHRKTETAT